jgi:hypothetical protein
VENTFAGKLFFMGLLLRLQIHHHKFPSGDRVQKTRRFVVTTLLFGGEPILKDG